MSISLIFWASILLFVILNSYSFLQNRAIKHLKESQELLLQDNELVNSNNQRLNKGQALRPALWHMLILFLICIGIVFTCNQLEKSMNSTYSEINNEAKDPSTYAESSSANNQPEQKNRNMVEIIKPNDISTNLSDIAGLKEVKQEVKEIIQYLDNPKYFTRLGAKPPKGLLMYGPPGTGKTLMARAMAGEAGVTFISVSGSQFEEEYVGVGASRVRQLFHIARKHAPCIIFIDEIDSVASKRRHHDISSTVQTLNQLLAEMDGLNPDKNNGIIVIGASNRIDVLDQAILRPGRFDRQVMLPLPNLNERIEILKVKASKVKISKSVNLDKIAKTTSGFSGADLQNLINEATINATQSKQNEVLQTNFEYAKDKIILGSTKDSIKLSEQEKKITAYHEAGHALVGLKLAPNHDPIYKITILPRGQSLGHTSFEPQKDYYLKSKIYLENRIASALGGRIAEELIFGSDQITTGASGDFKAATEIAYNMVTEWGFSEKIGPISMQAKNINKNLVEEEVKKIIERNYKRATEILTKNRQILDKIATALLERETLSYSDLEKI